MKNIQDKQDVRIISKKQRMKEKKVNIQKNTNKMKLNIAKSLQFDNCPIDYQFSLTEVNQQCQQVHQIPKITLVDFRNREGTDKSNLKEEKTIKKNKIIANSIPKYINNSCPYIPGFKLANDQMDPHEVESKFKIIVNRAQDQWRDDNNEHQPKTNRLRKQLIKKLDNEIIVCPQVQKTYCHVCKIDIKEYYPHIKGNSHKKKITSCYADLCLKQLVQLYQNKKIKTKTNPQIVIDEISYLQKSQSKKMQSTVEENKIFRDEEHKFIIKNEQQLFTNEKKIKGKLLPLENYKIQQKLGKGTQKMQVKVSFKKPVEKNWYKKLNIEGCQKIMTRSKDKRQQDIGYHQKMNKNQKGVQITEEAKNKPKNQQSKLNRRNIQIYELMDS